MQTLIEKVAQWGADKGITGPNGKGTYRGQYAKFLEEMGELFAALERKDEKEIRDALGDLQVVAIQACAITKVIEHINPDKPTRGNGSCMLWQSSESIRQFASDLPDSALRSIQRMAIDIGHDPEECLQEAYDVISKRTGKMVGGTFQKDSKEGA